MGCLVIHGGRRVAGGVELRLFLASPRQFFGWGAEVMKVNSSETYLLGMGDMFIRSLFLGQLRRCWFELESVLTEGLGGGKRLLGDMGYDNHDVKVAG